MTWSGAGKGLVLCGLVATLAVVFVRARPWSLIALALLVLWSAGLMAMDALHRRRAVQRFRDSWGPKGKDLLIVYSNSPHWQSYIEAHWLPRWGDRAVVLNWSERQTWRSRAESARADVALFQAVAGNREFNPLAIVVPPHGRDVHIVRFWKAFRDHKHGNPRKLSDAEAEVDTYLAGASNAAGSARS